ncbi:MAG: transporter substrate-binding domain-containing protein [Rheinheimera sp.]|nr:transporter substrate-binding domain-containing protein [Rheinheimera sp.]
MRFLSVLILLCSLWLGAAPAQSVRILGLQSSSEASVVYYRDLLQLVLDRTAAEYGAARLELEPPPPLGDYRYLLMKQDFIDVHHFGTSPELERDLLPVRVPLLAGGLGWRGFIIRKVDRLAFGQISDFAELKRLMACQGQLWPDTAIMRAAGLHVVTAERHDQMLEMLRRERCDYFPRSLFEGPIEQKAFQLQYPDLEFSSSVLLHYPFAMYFFVKKNNTALASRLEKGLDQLAQSGELLQFLQQHQIARQVFPLSRFNQSLVFHLDNPLLPANTPLQQAAYWLKMPAVQREISIAPSR